MGRSLASAGAFAGAVISFVMVPSAAFAASGGNSISATTAAVGAAVVLVLGLGSLVALIILKRLAAREQRPAAEITSEPARAEDELAA